MCSQMFADLNTPRVSVKDGAAGSGRFHPISNHDETKECPKALFEDHM